MGDEIVQFRSFIVEKGLRNTPEREEIIRAIFGNPDHFDVDELYLKMRRNGSRVSKASIYRNIPLIIEANLIREVWHEDGHMHYEPVLDKGHHCHLRCLGCGRVIEFVSNEVIALERSLGKKHQFNIVDHRLEVLGYCSNCKDNTRVKNSITG